MTSFLDHIEKNRLLLRILLCMIFTHVRENITNQKKVWNYSECNINPLKYSRDHNLWSVVFACTDNSFCNIRGKLLRHNEIGKSFYG